MAPPTLLGKKPTKQTALAALRDMRERSVWVPGTVAVIVLSLLAQNFLFCAVAVATTLYLSRLWSRLEEQPKQSNTKEESKQ